MTTTTPLTGPLDLTFITSLYRAEAFLPRYSQQVREVAAALHAAGRRAEAVLVLNDGTPAERALLDALARDGADVLRVTVIEVPRETLYASWARAAQQAAGRVLTPWNVDDVRTSAALLDGLARIDQGCALVDFPYTLNSTYRQLHGGTVQARFDVPALYYRKEARRKSAPPAPDAGPGSHGGVADIAALRTGPFFLFTAALYEQVGPFDARYVVAGDADWTIRAAQHTPFCESPVSGGTFYYHGGNLSRVDNPHTAAELNMIRLLHGQHTHLEAADPQAMRALAAQWPAVTLPPAVEALLWGAAGQARYRRARRRAYWQGVSVAVRTLGSEIVDRTGTRRLLARLKLVNPHTHTEAP